ncbi:patatin [Pseudoxanthomonas jiangsuensis]|uniref:patatin-like phospholipase family protein n=1 Tax=Pseudoxanthomonas jiangsuensis TaxID=619688 RepID=UPI001391B41E|nr:patatin-like phospholipase family protein [Pseudoxanthomonas jiangsuensis]KAF1695182.1 patatin [Pseudoxanthomonas jiangsuensis]
MRNDLRRHGPAPAAASARPRHRRRPAAGLLLAWLLSTCLFSTCLWSAPAMAAGGSCPQRDGDASRPRVGLALGGGGARGIAHISVLRKLEELRIPVDCIAGTSMGSLVGGLYASGMSVDQLEALVVDTDWKAIFDDSIERRERSYRRKQDDRDGLATIGVGVRDGKWSVSPGVLQGERILSLIERSTLGVSGTDDFDDLPVPFRAVATDINTGEAVELGSGSLSQAMRASMSLPGIFQPLLIDGHVLVDGGIAQQVPVDTVRRMGADIVVAVDVGTPLAALDADAGVLQVMYQLTGLLTVRNTRASTDSLGPGDVLVVPELGGEVGTGDFAKAADALRIGSQAAADAQPRLAALPRWRGPAPVREPGDPRPVVEFLRLENDSGYADAVLESILDVPLGRPLDAARLEASTLRIYSLGTFASVGYDVVREDGRAGVVVRAREKSQGPNYLQLGYRLQTDFSGTYDSSLRAALVRAPVTPLGAEARVTVDLGSEPAVRGEYYHPFDPQARWYFHGIAGAWNDNVPLFDAGGHRVATYDARLASVELGLGRTFGRYGAVVAGVERTAGKAQVEIGDPRLPEVEVASGVWFLRGAIDRLDSLYFPRRGYFVRADYRATLAALGDDTDFELAGVELLGARAFGRGAVQAGLTWRSTLSGELPLNERITMGGRGNLVGFHYNELTGQNALVAMLGYSWQLASVFGRSAVIGTTLEYGNAWERRADMRWGGGVFNGSAYIGFDSWIGPMLFGYGLREGGEDLLFLEIGQPF